MIAFKHDIELNIVDDFDEATETILENHMETFPAEEPVDAEIVSEDGQYVDLQFGGGGGVSFSVERASFDILPD